MKRYVAAVGLLGLVVWVGFGGSRADAQEAASMEGTWRLVEVMTTGPDGSTFSPQGGLAIYTPTHFTFVIDTAVDGRPTLSQDFDEATGDQFRATLGGFGAAAGTYELSGGELTWRYGVAMNPATTVPGNFLTARVEMDGDTVKVTPYTSSAGPIDNPTTFTMTRVR